MVMKKKIAIFANGWNSENLFRFIDGMSEVFEPCSADLFLFLSYASYGYDFSARRSESTVYDIPDLSSFDGAVVFGPGLNFAEVIDHIFKIRIKIIKKFFAKNKIFKLINLERI